MSPRLHTPTAFDAHIDDLLMGFDILATALLVLTLGAFMYTAWHPVSRPHLNRVSFRLLVYALCSSLGFALSMMVGVKLTANPACKVYVFFSNSFLMFAGAMFCSMAINLQLVLVHGVNGRKMEKYYIFLAAVMTLACNLPPLAAGAFGFWDVNSSCWFNSPERETQRSWFLGTQAFWMFAMSLCEVISFLTVLGHMVFRHRVPAQMDGLGNIPSPAIAKAPMVLYRAMILRIGSYPLFSCFFNITACMLDLHVIQDNAYTEVNWRLSIVDLLVYSLRPTLYTILAVTDPSFLRAVRALRHSMASHSAPTLPRIPFTLDWTTVETHTNTWPSAGGTSASYLTQKSGQGSSAPSNDTGIPKPEGENAATDVNGVDAEDVVRQI